MLIDIHTHKLTTQAGELRLSNIDFYQLKDKTLSLNENALYSLGIHPWHADKATVEDFSILESYCQSEQVKLIGECGLDKLSEVDFDVQLEVFGEHIRLSEKLQKPLIIHCVRSFNEVFEIYKRVKPSQKWLIHGFRQNPQLAKQALSMGISLSFGQYFNAESVIVTDLDQLFIETDESDKALVEIYQEIAQIKNCKIEELRAASKLLKL